MQIISTNTNCGKYQKLHGHSKFITPKNEFKLEHLRVENKTTKKQYVSFNKCHYY